MFKDLALLQRLEGLQIHLAPHRKVLLNHEIYSEIDTVSRLKIFMEFHVFAVWDFMSLLKSLQRALTSVDIPWLPTKDLEARRLINSIILGEESDEDGCGGYQSHFELYLEAMKSCGANTGPITAMCEGLRQGSSLREAMEQASVNLIVRDFVLSTFEVIERGNLSEIAAVFTLGREDVIPEMFQKFVTRLYSQSSSQFERLRFYLERHIHLDAEDHGPKALQMLASICGNRHENWIAAEKAAIQAIEARCQFWDGLAVEIGKE